MGNNYYICLSCWLLVIEELNFQTYPNDVGVAQLLQQFDFTKGSSINS